MYITHCDKMAHSHTVYHTLYITQCVQRRLIHTVEVWNCWRECSALVQCTHSLTLCWRVCSALRASVAVSGECVHCSARTPTTCVQCTRANNVCALHTCQQRVCIALHTHQQRVFSAHMKQRVCSAHMPTTCVQSTLSRHRDVRSLQYTHKHTQSHTQSQTHSHTHTPNTHDSYPFHTVPRFTVH